MKNVLFATTALVAFAGAAAAESHASGVTVDFGGEVTAGYNDDIEGGLFLDAALNINASIDLGDNVTASFEWDFLEADENGIKGTGHNPSTDDIATFTVAYDNGSISAKLIAGDQDDDGAGEMWYADRSGMAVDISNWDNNSDDFTAVAEFGNFGIAATTCSSCNGTSYGAKAAFGSIELGLGFDDFVGGTRTAVSADATFGSFDVGVSYITETFGNTDSLGLEVGGTFGSIEVGAYYAMNSDALISDAFGVSADYAAGALTVGAYFDSEDDGLATATAVTSYGLDVGYALSDALTASAGVYSDGTFVYYVGVEYTVNDNISATVAYATADEISGPEFKDGISAFITASF